MKKILLVLAALFIFCMALPTAFAEGTAPYANEQGGNAPEGAAATDAPAPSGTADTGDPAKTDDPQDPPAAEVTLTIDNANVYAGMDKAYRRGYTPSVKNGVATIVLPLIASGEIKGNKITVTPNLGDPSGSPFVYKNYQTTVALTDQTVLSGKTVAAYLVRFDLPLKSGRTNGVYPVVLDIRAKAADGSAMQQSFTTYVTITDGKAPASASPGATGTPKPTPQPKVIVSGYTIDPSPQTAGSEFTASITLKNTNEKKYVQNMTVTVASDCPNLTILNESNAFYIKRLEKGETTQIDLKLKSDLTTPPKRYTLTLAIEYDNSEATTLTAAGAVPIEIVQPLRVDMQPPQIAPQVNAGDTLPLTFEVMNLGRSMVYNVRCQMNVPGIITGGSAFIGNMDPGTAKTAKVDAFVGTMDMNGGKGQYGQTKGTVKLVYEDENGKEYTKDIEITTTINEPVVIQPPEEEKKVTPEMAGQWWISLLIAAALIAAAGVILLSRRKRKAKHDEDL